MQRQVLDAKVRHSEASLTKIRQSGLIPAVIYGKGVTSMSVEVSYQPFRKAFRQAGYTGVIDLDIDGDKKPVLVHDIQYDPVKDTFTHIDFLVVDLKKKVTASVPVEVVGESEAVKSGAGLVTMVKHEVEVKCLPMDIPHSIVIDVSKLPAVGDAFRVSDLGFGDKVEVVDLEADEPLVLISATVEQELERDVSVPDEIKAEPVAESTEEKKA